MKESIDVTAISDPDKLKALCYDQIRLLKDVQSNITLIEARLEQLAKEQAPVIAPEFAPAPGNTTLDPAAPSDSAETGGEST